MRRILQPTAVLLAATACGSPTGADPALTAAVELSAGVVRAGAPVAVTVRVTNPGTRPQPLYANTCAAATFEVLDASGAVVGPAGRVCNMLAIARLTPTLGAGESAVIRDAWAGDFLRPAPTPGVYRIRARVPLGSSSDYARSAPAEIRVEP